MTSPLPLFMLGLLSWATPMMLRLKCDPLGAPLPVEAFCAAAAVAVIPTATAAARENVRRMRLLLTSRVTAGAAAWSNRAVARFSHTMDVVARGGRDPSHHGCGRRPTDSVWSLGTHDASS